MKKILIITYYWPPSGGAGVQRWLFFAKYLSELGHEVHVLTVDSDEYPVIDNELLKLVPKEIKVHKSKIWEPFSIYRKVTNKPKTHRIQSSGIVKGKRSFLETLSIWVRSNLFIPDARMFWIKKGAKEAVYIIEKHSIDNVISSGPPHSTHLIAKRVKNRFRERINWIADFRDPWTGIDFYNDLLLTSLADRIHHKLERQVLLNSDKVLVVSKGMKQEFLELGVDKTKIEVITNGYKDDGEESISISIDKSFSITYIGTLNSARNHESIWKGLRMFLDNCPKAQGYLKVQLIGNITTEVHQYIDRYNLNEYVSIDSYKPLSEVLTIQNSSQLLYLPINNSPNAKSVLTGKFFEYLKSRRPIIAIGPLDGEVHEVLNECKAGEMADFEDSFGISKLLKKNFNTFIKFSEVPSESRGFEKYSRKYLADKVAKLLT